MRNRAISLLLVFIFCFTTFIGNGFSVNAMNSNSKNYSFKLHATQEYLDNYRDGVINPATVDSTIKKFGSKVNDKTWLNLNLQVGDGESPYVSGNGVLHIGTDNFPLNIEGELDQYVISNDKKVYFGPVYGRIKSNKGDEDIIIGLYLDPEKNVANASLSVGAMDENGVSILLFGETNADFGEVIDVFESRASRDSATDEEPIQNEVEVVEEGGFSTASTSGLGDYTYVSSGSSKWYSEDSGWWDITKAPPNSEILNLADDYIIILDAFKGDMGNSAINRVWSNSNKVKQYTGAQVADAFAVYSWFGSSSPNISIHTVGPTNGTSIKLPTWIGYAAAFTKLGAVYTIVEQFLNWGFSQSVSVADQSSLKLHDTYSNRTYQRGKYIKYVGTQANLRSTVTDLHENAKLNGGASFNFDYYNYGSGKSLKSGAQIAYGVSYDFHIAYVWSDKVYVSWTQ